MAIYALGDRVPDIHDTAFVHPDATVIGSVVLGPYSSIWPQAVLRGDYGTIRIGARSSVQDGAVLHCIPDPDTFVGEDVTIGHLAHLEGCLVEDGAPIGVGCAVLHRAVIGSGATVGAGAVITNDMKVPPRALAVGIPAQIKPDRSDPERLAAMARAYVDNQRRYVTELRRLD